MAQSLRKTMCNDTLFFLDFAPLAMPATFIYLHTDYLLGGVAVKPILAKDAITLNIRHELQ